MLVAGDSVAALKPFTVDSVLLPKIMALVSAGIEYFAAKGHIQLILGPMFSGKT